jgi:hypothetical protein
MRTNREPSGRLWRGLWSGRGEENGPFQGLQESVVFLLGASLCSLSSQVRDCHDLLREKPSSLLMLLGWSSISSPLIQIRISFIRVMSLVKMFVYLESTIYNIYFLKLSFILCPMYYFYFVNFDWLTTHLYIIL